MRRVKELHDLLDKKLEDHLKQLKQQKEAELKSLQERITSSEKFSGFSEPDQTAFIHSFEAVSKQIAALDSIPVIESTYQRFEGSEYTSLLARLETKPAQNTETQPKPKQEIVRVKVRFAKPLLSTEADVDDYTEQMKQELLKEIKAGKKVQV